jgi:hypothetical protein
MKIIQIFMRATIKGKWQWVKSIRSEKHRHNLTFDVCKKLQPRFLICHHLNTNLTQKIRLCVNACKLMRKNIFKASSIKFSSPSPSIFHLAFFYISAFPLSYS